INGLLTLPRPHLSSVPGTGKAAQAWGEECRRGVLGDSELGKAMATSEGTRAAVCAALSRCARRQRDDARWRRFRPPNRTVLGEHGQARWEGELQRVSDGGGSCQSLRPA